MLLQWLWRRRPKWIAAVVVVTVLLFYNASIQMNILREPFTLLRNPTISRNWTMFRNSTVSTVSATIEAPTCSEHVISKVEEEPLAKFNLRLGRWDLSRTFRIFDHAAVGELYPDTSASRQVCLATQSSIKTSLEILKIAAHWSGPISLAVFVIGEEMSNLRGFATWLSICQPDVYSRISIHIATPAYKPAEFGILPDWARNCSAEPSFTTLEQYEAKKWKLKHPYPQNMLRNLARKNCHSRYVYLVDVDIVPSIGMAEALDEFLSSSGKCERCAFVIPTYELDWSVARFPANKSELLQLTKKNLAVPFHKKIYIYNQLSSNLKKWEASRGLESNKTHVSHNVDNYKLFYEPFYVAPDTVPPHDERFLGYGFTRNSQVYEMYLIGYQFKVLSPIFTIHWGLQSNKRPGWRMAQVKKNYQRFKTFKKELFAKYGKEYVDRVHEKTAPKVQNTTK